jgi:ATP-dependent RNA helicase RhlE
MSFENLKIIPPILRALEAEGYTNPTPIQAQAIPELLEGKDLLGCAQTGTGKTAAFVIPIIQKLFKTRNPQIKQRVIKALILTPTRELAAQISDSFSTYGKFLGLRNTVIYGGVSQRPQVEKLNHGVDIVIATPGRLLDLINQRFVKLGNVEFFVLDEADHMLDMGFITDVKKIIEFIPTQRQTMLFSATMPSEIGKLANTVLKDPVKVSVTPVSSPVDVIEQSLYYVSKKNKKNLLIHLLKDTSVASALIFSRTKHGANKICDDLNAVGIQAEAIHGNKSQLARQISLNRFKAKQIRVLVATDIAARGIDIDELSHVVNYDLPEVPETYVHRIGRTGRAGLSGTAFSFCDIDERGMLKDIQRLIARNITVVEDHPHKEIFVDTIPITRSTSYRSFNGNARGKSRGFGKSRPKR